MGVAPPTAVRWAAQIARALESVHAEGILHRDVKPSPDGVFPGQKLPAQVATFDLGPPLVLRFSNAHTFFALP